MKKRRIIAILLLSVLFAPSISLGQDDGLGGILKFATKDQSIEEIMQVIINNHYEFKVKRNRIFDMPPEEKAQFFNIGKMDADKLRELLNGPTRVPPPDDDKTLPDKYDLRNHNGHSYIGEVRDQGTCGSCYAFATAAAAESSYNLAKNQFDSNCVDFSEAYTAFCLSRLEKYKKTIKGCNGATLESFFTPTVEGVAYEKEFPYTGKDPGQCPDMSMPTIKFSAAGVIECKDIDTVKSAIYKYGAVWVTVLAIPAFQSYSEGIYEDTNVECNASCFDTPSNHAVSIVGWDDNGDPEKKGYWILRNSWGSKWGENGYMRIRYRSANILCSGVAYLVYDKGSAKTDQPVPVQSESDESVKPSEEDAKSILLE